MAVLLKLTLVILSSLIQSALLKEKPSEDRSDWVNPNDMLNFDPTTNKMLSRNKPKVETPSETSESVPEDCPGCQGSKKEGDPLPIKNEGDPVPSIPCPECKCEPQQNCVCDQATLPLLRQYIRTILQHLKDQMPSGKTEDYTMHLSMSADQALILENFVSSGNQKHVHDVHDILTGMIDRVATSRLSKMEKAALWLEDKIGLPLDRVIQFVQLAAFASVVLLIEVKLQIPWRRRISQLIVLMFLISVPWTWYELYKQAEIKQQSVVSRPMPKECQTGEQSYWSSVWSTIWLQDDKCHAYHEHLMIDPLIKVPPTKAIAITFVRFFVAPLKDVGTAMSEFIRALLIDLPVTLYPIAIGMVGFFLFLFLFMWFGYSIRLPFFLTIERNPQLTVADSHLQQAITDASQQTLNQLEKIQAQLETTNNQVSEKLQSLERVQQVAIEYTLSSAPSSPAESPSISRTAIASADSQSKPVIESMSSSFSVKEVRPNVSQSRPISKTAVLSKSHTLFEKTGTKMTDSEPSKFASHDKGEPDEKTDINSEQTHIDEAKFSSYQQKFANSSEAKSVLAIARKCDDDSQCVPLQKVVDTLLPDGVIESRDNS